MKSLRNKARLFTEEQGINALYLSFGFLHWKEAQHSEEYYNAPLILVPVKLTLDSISSPYRLSMHEDEIVVNPTLMFKLQQDFGITLPEFDPEIGVSAYFDLLKPLISYQNWEIYDEVWLSLLSFLKINMYYDLDKFADKFAENSNVRAIAGDTTAAEKIPNELNYYDFDKNLKPTDLFQILDADSSQQDAALCAKKGISFVLQGPPGTGKSQTITNIIAEALADDKKILFISEKWQLWMWCTDAFLVQV